MELLNRIVTIQIYDPAIRVLHAGINVIPSMVTSSLIFFF